MRHSKAILRKHWGLLLLVGADLFVFFGINPKRAPSIVLMIGLLLLLCTTYAFIGLCIDVLGGAMPLLRRRRQKIRVFLSLLAAFLVGLQSIGQLTAKDGAATIPFLVVGYFYLVYPSDNHVSDDHKR